MQHVSIGRSVLGLAFLFASYLPTRTAAKFEELVRAEDEHEDAAHDDFVNWCRAATAKLSDRVASRKEHIAELDGAIESYGEIVAGLRNSTQKAGMPPLDLLSQDRKLTLIRTESEHWRGVHAKKAVERLLEADQELLSGVSEAMQWEEKAHSQHRAARQQLIDWFHEHPVDQPVDQPFPHQAVALQAASQREDAALPRVLQQAQIKRRVTQFDSAGLASSLSQRPRPTTLALSSAAAVKVPSVAAPILGVTQLPALQLMQADDHQVHAAAAQAVSPQKSASELLVPMSMGDPLLESALSSPLLSLAGMSTGGSVQAASTIKEISSQLGTAGPAPISSNDAQTKLQAALLSSASDAQLAAQTRLPSPVQAAAVRSPVAAHDSIKVRAPSIVRKTQNAVQHPSMIATTLASAVARAIPMPSANSAPTLAQKASPSQSFLEQTKNQDGSAEQTKNQDGTAEQAKNQDPEDALMAIMIGGGEDSPPMPSSNQSPTRNSQLELARNLRPPPTKPYMGSSAFMGLRSAHPPVQFRKVVRAGAVAPPPQAAPEDPEDALMEVMMQGGPGSAVDPPQNKQKTLKHAPHVLAQTAQAIQQVHGSHASSKQKRTPKLLARTPKSQPSPDSEAGVMNSFIQEVSDLAQGEAGESDSDPAEPVKEQQQQQVQESEAHMMNTFVQEVSQLAQGETVSQEAKPTAPPTTAAGMALSSDLATLMGLNGGAQPASFLQVASNSYQKRALSRSELAAAALLSDLDYSQVSNRLAKTVSKLAVDANVAMLTALREQLQGHQLQWSCSKGTFAAHSHAVLQLAEAGTSLLLAERSTVASLGADLRDAQTMSADLRSQLVTALDQSIGHGYEEEEAELQTLPLATIRNSSPVTASAIVSMQNRLLSDASAAKHMASQLFNKGSAFVRLGDELLQTSRAKDDELQRAKKVLSDARGRAAASRKQAAKEVGCSEAARTSALIAAVYRALDILQN